MYIIYPGKATLSQKEQYLQKDKAFMEGCIEVLTNIPETWKKYPDTIEGACKIVDMEANEITRAITKEDKSCECIHLASACLNLWRKLNYVSE